MQGSKIKLLIAVPSLTCGGAEKNVAVICNNINSDTFDVTLIILDNSTPFFKITNPAVKTIDLKIASVRKSLFAIAKLSRQIRPDVILTAANHLNLFFGIFKWLFPKRVKIIGRESSIISSNTPTNWKPGFYNWLCRTFYKNLDLVVCQSDFMRDDLVKNYKFPLNKTQIINNPVQTPLLPGELTTPEKNSIPRLITVARLTQLKGLLRIVRSLSMLDIPFEYFIIGEGEQRPELEELIRSCSLEKKVFLYGSSQTPFALVETPSLFLMGSYFEGFPNVLLEANAAGIPVIAFNAPGGIGELIINYQNGILVKDNNEADFAAAVKTALTYPFNHNKIIRDTNTRFDIKKIMLQWESLFQSISNIEVDN